MPAPRRAPRAGRDNRWRRRSSRTTAGSIRRRRSSSGRLPSAGAPRRCSDGEQFVHAVRAGVARPDRRAARAPTSARAQVGIVAQARADGRSISAASRAIRKSSPGAEQTLGVSHGARDQRNAAGQRLEHADRRDAGQHARHRSAAARAPSPDGGRTSPAPARSAASRDSARRAAASIASACVGIAHAVDVERQAGVAAGAAGSRSSLGAALAVAPVADPDQPLALALRRPADGTGAYRPPRARRTRGRPSPSGDRPRRASRRRPARRRSRRGRSARMAAGSLTAR